MNPAVSISLAVAAVLLCTVVLALTAREIARFRRRESLLSKQQIALRCVGACVLVVLILQILGGVAFVKYASDAATEVRTRSAIFFLVYWLVCGLLTAVLLIIVRMDYQHLSRRHRDAQKELLRREILRSAKDEP